MAMVVKNNAAATNALNQLNRNSSDLAKRLQKVSSGMRINGAEDDASGYAVSERMRVQIRGLDQDIQNVKSGRALLKIADGGIGSIVEELRTLKELALNSANDHNSDVDRATLQKEFDSRKANIDEIASETNYNGKILLDGTYRQDPRIVEVRSTAIDVDTIDDAPFPYTSIARSVPEPTAAGAALPATGPYTIDADGVYEIPAGYTGELYVNAANVKLTQADPATPLDNIQIIGPSGGNANLWIENLNATTAVVDSLIKFRGGDNVLTLRGSNTLATTGAAQDYATINTGGGLLIQGDGASALSLDGNAAGAAIGSNKGQALVGDIGIVNAKISVNGSSSQNSFGSAVGSGGNGGSIGNITIENSSIRVTDPGGTGNSYHACIGSGAGNSSAGDILIVSSDIDTVSTDTGIGSGFSGSTCGTITIDSSTLNIRNRDSACVGAGDAGGTCEDIYLSDTTLNGSSMHGAGVGSGRGAHAKDIRIVNSTKITHVSGEGAAIGSGLNGTVGTVYISQSSLDLLNASRAYSDDTHVVPGIGRGEGGAADDMDGEARYVELEGVLDGHPLVIHYGTKPNDALNIYINDMHTKSMGIEDTKINPREAAAAAIDTVDKAIEYALNEATHVGAYISRLNYMESNLEANHENTQGAESTIRDADMAREMMEYTKANILSQSSQSILAQANSNASTVLSLLQ